MSSARVPVEWVFGKMINYFKFLHFWKNLKIKLSAVCIECILFLRYFTMQEVVFMEHRRKIILDYNHH